MFQLLREKKFAPETDRVKKIASFLEDEDKQNQIAYIDSLIRQFSKGKDNSSIQNYWGNRQWMERILYFLLPVDKKEPVKEKYRFKIVSDLYSGFHPKVDKLSQEERNPYKEYHFILKKMTTYYLNLAKK